MKGNQNANMSREEFNNVQAKQVANTAYNGNELYDKGIVRGKIFVLPEEMRNERVEITLNEGYQFVDENGNVINAKKIVLEKKKKEYPKTYAECCRVLGVSEFEYNHTGTNVWHRHKLMATLDNLMLCRDAYWKIAGDEIGLGKPWKPDWNTSEPKYVIAYTSNGIEKQWETTYCKVFAFPTAEMRDAFKENFDPDIEICKELL